jgi:hypothetical protein
MNNQKINLKQNNNEIHKLELLNQSKERITLDVIFTNLENLSKINIGDKLTHDDKYIMVDNSYLKSITRWYYKTSRYTILDFINKILEQSYEHLDILRNNNDETSGILWLKLISKLKQCANGLLKLRKTYATDEEFLKKIDELITKLLKKT